MEYSDGGSGIADNWILFQKTLIGFVYFLTVSTPSSPAVPSLPRDYSQRIYFNHCVYKCVN